MDDGKNSGGAETGRRLSAVALGSGAAGVLLGLVGLVGWQGLVEWRAKGSGDAGRSAIAEAELELGKARDAERRARWQKSNSAIGAGHRVQVHAWLLCMRSCSSSSGRVRAILTGLGAQRRQRPRGSRFERCAVSCARWWTACARGVAPTADVAGLWVCRCTEKTRSVFC